MGPRRAFAAMLAAACTGPAPTVDTDPPPTSDDTGDVPSSPYMDDGVLAWTPGFGHSVASLSSEPRVVAVSRRARWVYDWFEPPRARILRIHDEDVSTLGSLGHDTEEPAWAFDVAAIPDVTGDGAPDLAVSADPFQVVAGPAWETDPLEVPRMSAAGSRVMPCDAGSDGRMDLCSSVGVDLHPIDGEPDISWEAPPEFDVWVIASGAWMGTAATWVLAGTLEAGHALIVVQIPAAGEVPFAGPTWNPAVGWNSIHVAPVDADSDGSDGLLVCGVHDDLWSLFRVEPFPAEAPGSLALPGRCDALEVADYDGDGDPEVAVGAGSRVLIVDPVSWTVLAEHVGAVRPLDDEFGFALDSADLDGDGRADLVVGAPGAGRVYFLTDVMP